MRFIKILSVDLGETRTGLAICDSNGVLASPLGVITEKGFKACANKVAAIAKENSAEEIVVGLPVNMDGTNGEKAERCEDFARLLEKITGIRVTLFDERQTTMLAHVYLNYTDTRGKKRKETVDEVAAVIILENYLRFLRTLSDKLKTMEDC